MANRRAFILFLLEFLSNIQSRLSENCLGGFLFLTKCYTILIMKKFLIIAGLIILLILILSGSKEKTLNSSSEKSGSTSPKTTAPGTVSTTSTSDKLNTAGWIDSPFVSRDGKRLYFWYSRYNFWPMLLGKGDPVFRGPVRPGWPGTGSYYTDGQVFYATRNTDGSWGKVEWLPFTDSRAPVALMEVVGPPRKLYYIVASIGNGSEIVTRTEVSEGKWGSENNIQEVNSSSNEQNPHIWDNDLKMAFTSDRPGGRGKSDIWFSTKDPATKIWSAPVNAGPVINTAGNEDQWWAKEDGSEFFFTRDGNIYRTTEQDGVFTPPVLTFKDAAEASLPDNGKEMYFIMGDPVKQLDYIMVSKRKSDGSWTTPVPVD